ncbi:MAG: SpoIIE family protein phosphatase [Candidatus Omnitrophota bacterium]
MAVATCIILGLFVYFKGRHKAENRLFALTSIFAGVWCSFPFLTNLITDNASALFWARIVYIPAVFVPATFAHFGFIVSEYKKPVKYFYMLSVVLLIVLPTPLFLKGITRLPYHAALIAGPFLHIFILFFGAVCGWSFYALYKRYKTAIGQKKNQVKYVFAGFILAYIGGLVHFSPIYTHKSEIFPHDFLLVAFMMVISYSIIKYKTMDIDTVIHRTALWLLALLFLVLPVSLLVALFKGWLAEMTQPEVITVVSLLLVLFVWYYNKVRPYIDHFFRRKKYDYYKVLAEIGQRVGVELDIKNVISRLFKELKEVLYLRNGLVLVQQPGQADYLAAGATGYEDFAENKWGELTINGSSAVIQWLGEHKKALEKEQIEVDPQYKLIKDEFLPWLNKNMIDILIPVILEERVNGLIGLGKKENLQAYTTTDIELLEKMGRQIGVTIDNALHHEDIIEKERLAEELKLGREIQQNLLPKTIPALRGLRLEGLMLPAKEIGGDYYDYISTFHSIGQGKQSRVGVVIGDVSGKGVGAGLIMATAKATLKGLSQQDLNPKQILAQANNVLYEYTNGQKFMTLLYFQYKEEDRTLSYSSAGHEHILIYRNELGVEGVVPRGTSPMGSVEAIISGGFMLGMMPDIETYLEDRELHLQLHDKVLLYTDGVTEAENHSGERFGLDRLKEAFQKHGAKPADELMKAVKEDVYSYIGSHPQYDDITLVVLEAT